MTSAARERFTALVRGPEGELDLAEAALLIAKEEQPELDVAHYLNRLLRGQLRLVFWFPFT